MKKEQTSFYITQEIRDLVKFLAKREDLTKTAFYKKALKFFFEEDSEIDARILIKERNHPDYVRRDVLESLHFEPEQLEAVRDMAGRYDCSEGAIIYMALLNYCAMWLSIDSTGVTIEE